MAFNNAIDAKQQGTQYLSTTGQWSGMDGGAAGQILTSNGTGVAPSFQASGASVASLSPYIVGTTGTNDFTTIQAAITAAGTTQANIYIKPGVYTENLTISSAAMINLIAVQDNSDFFGFTELNGSLTMSGTAVTCLVQGLQIQNSTDAIIVSCDDSFLILDNVNVNTSGTAKCINCTSSTTTVLSIRNSFLQNSGSGDCLVINSGGMVAQIAMLNSGILANTGKAINVAAVDILSGSIDGNYSLNPSRIAITGAMVWNGNSGSTFRIRNAICDSGSAIAISSATSGDFSVDIENCSVTSSNATAIDFPNVNATGAILKINNSQLSFDLNKINFPEIQCIDNCTSTTSSYEINNRHFVSADNLGLSNIKSSSSLALLQTTDATPANIYSFTLSTNESVSFFVEVSAVKSDYSLHFSSTLIAGARRAGAGATLVGTPVAVPVKDVTFTGSITGTVSGNSLNVQVTGIAATTIEWQCLVRYQTL